MSKVWMLVLTVALALGLGLPMNANADQATEGGTDRPGSDYRRIEIEPGTIAGSSICRGFCVKDNSCTAWTFVASGVQGPKAQCYLKAGTPAAVPNPCCQSGLVAHALEPNIDRPGMDYFKFAVYKGPGECKALCDKDAKCLSYTYVVPGVQAKYPLCYLKTGVPDATGNDCCISGVKSHD